MQESKAIKSEYILSNNDTEFTHTESMSPLPKLIKPTIQIQFHLLLSCIVQASWHIALFCPSKPGLHLIVLPGPYPENFPKITISTASKH